MDGQIEVKPIVDTIAKRIRERRRTLGLTQEKLAERAGLSVNYLAQLEISDKRLRSRPLPLWLMLWKRMYQTCSRLLRKGGGRTKRKTFSAVWSV